MIDGVRTETGTFSGHNGTQLFARRWLPHGSPRAAVVIVHGYAEHSGRYEHVGQRLAAQGFAVHAFDLRGHGQSEGPRALVRLIAEYVADLRVVLADVRQRATGLPLFVLGHSMGGGVVALVLVDHSGDVEGALLSGAVLPHAGTRSRWRRIFVLVGRILPRLRLTKLPSDSVSRDPAVRRDYDGDKLNYRGRMKAGLVAAMIRATDRIDSNEEAITAPLMIMHGTADALTSPDGSRMLYERASSTDKTLRLYEGLYHEIFNEPERDQVIDDVIAWISERLPVNRAHSPVSSGDAAVGSRD